MANTKSIVQKRAKAKRNFLSNQKSADLYVNHGSGMTVQEFRILEKKVRSLQTQFRGLEKTLAEVTSLVKSVRG